MPSHPKKEEKDIATTPVIKKIKAPAKDKAPSKDKAPAKDKAPSKDKAPAKDNAPAKDKAPVQSQACEPLGSAVSIVLIETNGTLKTLKAKEVSLDSLYKKCGYRVNDDFLCRHTRYSDRRVSFLYQKKWLHRPWQQYPMSTLNRWCAEYRHLKLPLKYSVALDVLLFYILPRQL